MNCRKCGIVNADSARFCSNCGTLLIPIKNSPEKTLVERRQLTVLFSDIIGSTALSERLDPEDLRQIISRYREACTNAIFLYEGYLASFIGDGVFAYFSYPTTHEDDARRAVQAGLDIIRSIKIISARIEKEYGVPLEVRIGIHTGLVVIGDIDKSDALESRLIIGQTPNFAARIQATAKPNTVHISDNTNKLIHGYFESTELGVYNLKGVSQPATIYRIHHASTASSRLDINRNQLVPFVGREVELNYLYDIWQSTQTGKGQVVLLTGEAGIGKSRLLLSLKEYISQESVPWLTELKCSPYHRSSSFYPVINFLEGVVQFEKNESSDEKLVKIEDFLTQYDIDLAKSVFLIASLLSISYSTKYAPPALTPQKQKKETIELLKTIFLQRAKRKSLLFVFEDLHWSDPSTMEIIDLLLEQCCNYKILVLLVYRPNFKPTWCQRDNMSTIELTGLSDTYAGEIIRCVSNIKELSNEAKKHIIEKTDGIPLFLEELTKTMVESGMLIDKGDQYDLSASFNTLDVPATIQDSLAARLDRFPQAKQVAQLASVIGREFSYNILESIPGEHRNNLCGYLDQLVEAGIIFKHDSLTNGLYSFKHALIQDTAYSTLLKSTRKSYHKLIAEAMEAALPNLVETQPELLAQHYTKAFETEKAIQLWLAAGLRALQQSANAESISHIKQGLKLVDAINESTLRTSLEVQLYSTLGPALIATRGFGDAEVGKTYEKLSQLSQLYSNGPNLTAALWGQWVYSLVRSELIKAHSLALEMKEFGQETNDFAILVEGHWALGNTLFWLADFSAADDELKKSIEIYNPKQHHVHAHIYGQDPCVAAHCYQSYNYWYLGHLDKAYAANAAATKHANLLQHQFSIGWSLAFKFMVRMFGNEYLQAKKWSERAIKHANDQAYPFWKNAATIVYGWAISMTDNPRHGISYIEQGLIGWDVIDSIIARPMFMGLYAEALGSDGQTEKAHDIIDDAILLTRKHSEVASELDLHRIKGELQKKDGKWVEAEASFRHGIELSRKYHSPSRKLQASVALYKLLKDTDKEQKSADILKDSIAEFHEGKDRTMIKEAKALLGNYPHL